MYYGLILLITTLQVNYSFYDAQKKESVRIPRNVGIGKTYFLRGLELFTNMNETFDLSG